MGTILTGDQRERIGHKLFELGRQVFLQKEYGFCPEELDRFLQRAVDGKFNDEQQYTIDPDGVIHFTVTFVDGTSGADWIPSLEKIGVSIGEPYAKSVLRSSELKPTNGITYHIAVLPGKKFEDANRTTANIRAEGDRRGWKHGKDLPAEIACLIRRKFTNKQINAMGLRWIIVMHEAITACDGDLRLLGVFADGAGPWLNAYYGSPGSGWFAGDGFAFLEQVSSSD